MPNPREYFIHIKGSDSNEYQTRTTGVIREPVILSAADAAFIISMLGPTASYTSEHREAVRLLSGGSDLLRERVDLNAAVQQLRDANARN